MSLGSQISHIATNKGNIERQCSIYNVHSIKDVTLDSKQRKDSVLSIKDITLDSKQRKDDSDLWVKTLNPQGQLTG